MYHKNLCLSALSHWPGSKFGLFLPTENFSERSLMRLSVERHVSHRQAIYAWSMAVEFPHTSRVHLALLHALTGNSAFTMSHC